MDYKDIINELYNLGDPRARKVLERFGQDSTSCLGVNLTKLKKLSREIGKNHELAIRLWNSGIHDAMLLATMVEDPRNVSEEQIDTWIMDIDTRDICDKFCSNIVVRTSCAYRKMNRWIHSDEEYQRRAGFMLLTLLARKDEWLSDADYTDYLRLIEREINAERNWVKEAMNYALIAIGSHNIYLNEIAREVASNIGAVNIDYGDSGCKVPDARMKLSEQKLTDKLNLRIMA